MAVSGPAAALAAGGLAGGKAFAEEAAAVKDLDALQIDPLAPAQGLSKSVERNGDSQATPSVTVSDTQEFLAA